MGDDDIIDAEWEDVPGETTGRAVRLKGRLVAEPRKGRAGQRDTGLPRSGVWNSIGPVQRLLLILLGLVLFTMLVGMCAPQEPDAASSAAEGR